MLARLPPAQIVLSDGPYSVCMSVCLYVLVYARDLRRDKV